MHQVVCVRKKKGKKRRNPAALKTPPPKSQQPGYRDHLETAFDCDETSLINYPRLARFYRPRVRGNPFRTQLLQSVI